MKKNTLHLKTISLILTIIFVITNVVGILNLFNKKATIYATSNQTAVEIQNQNFNDTAVTGSVISPSGWTTINQNDATTIGIITLDDTIFAKQQETSYNLSFKPYRYNGMSDNQILMINAENENANTGYKSPSITLNSNSYYEITFMALTENTNYATIGSANLSGNDLLKDTSISIVTNGNWIEYTFLIETDKINNTTAYIEFWLGYQNGVQSKGAIFFDNLNVYELSETAYNTIKNSKISNTKTAYCNLNTSVLSTQVTNNTFEANTLTGWTSIGESTKQGNYAGIINFNNTNASIYKLDNMPQNNNIYESNQALLINNVVGSKIGYKSSAIFIKQHGTYKITFYAKSNIDSGSSVVKIVENDPYNGTYSTFKTKSFDLIVNTTSLTNSKNNDWIEYNIYIQGRSFEDTSINLELWLGDDEDAIGYAMFDNFVIYQISSANYEAGIAKSNVLEANFSSEASSELTINNGKFNLVENETAMLTYPLSAKNWTNSKVLDNQIESGIINTKDTSMISRITSSYLSKEFSNNILMLGNIGKNSQKYVNDNAFTLSANSYYKLTFSVQTQLLSNNATAGFKLYTSDFTIKELMYIESNNEWATYTLYIATGENSYNCYVELSLGQKNNGSGYAFFDDVILSTSTETAYNATLKANSYKINLKSDDFTNTNNIKIDNLYQSNSYSPTNASSTTDIITGIVDVLGEDVFTGKIAGITNPNLPEGLSGNALLIKSSENCNYYYTSNETYSLASGKYYKISVWVYTATKSNFFEWMPAYEIIEDENIVTDNNKYNNGAKITLTNIDKSFIDIETNGEWKQYTFYINATDDVSTQIQLGLENQNEETLTTKDYHARTVFFTGVTVETIEQDDYYTAVKPLEEDDAPTNIMAVGSTKIETTENKEEEKNEISFNWLIISTLVTAVALLAAIIGVGIRKFIKKHPKPVKIKTKEYNREISLEKDFEHREAIRKQREKLEKLKEKLENVKFEIIDTRSEFVKEQRKQKQKVQQEIAEIKKEQREKQIKIAKLQKSTTLDKSDNAELIAQIKKQKAELKAQKQEQRAEIRAYKLEQKRLFNEEKLAKYKQRQKELQDKFNAIEMEIEVLYQEELRLIELYKEYKRQVRLKKKELRLEKKKQKQESKQKKNKKQDDFKEKQE